MKYKFDFPLPISLTNYYKLTITAQQLAVIISRYTNDIAYNLLKLE